MKNTEVVLPREDDALLLNDDELAGVLSLNLVDELDVTVTVLPKVLHPSPPHNPGS